MMTEPLTDDRLFSILHPPSSVRRIAVFRALFLGDMLCATPALRALRRRFPAAHITLIGLPWAREFVGRLPYIDRWLEFPGYPGINEVVPSPERTAAFLAEARAFGYDLAIQMHGDGSVSNGFVADLGARVSLGYCRGDDPSTSRLPSLSKGRAGRRLTVGLPYCDDEHQVLRWLRLANARLEIGDWRLEALESPISNLQSPISRLDFPITPEDRRAADLLLGAPAAPLIGMHAGAKDPARRWPPERFAALADALIERFDARIVLTGSADERPLTAAARRAMRYPALDLAGETDLGALAAVVARLDLLVTNDTGASHIAAATGTRSVVLFSASRPAEWAPLDRERHRVIDALALAGHTADPGEALRRLPIAPVLAACEALLGFADHRPPTADHRPRSEELALAVGEGDKVTR